MLLQYDNLRWLDLLKENTPLLTNSTMTVMVTITDLENSFYFFIEDFDIKKKTRVISDRMCRLLISHFRGGWTVLL